MPRRARRLVTLLSDVGAAYAAQLRAVLSRYVPPGTVVDLTHELSRHAVDEAGFLLRAIGSRFPAGTIHVAIVDPGVGGRRAPLAVVCADGSVLIGPDNGVLAPLAEELGSPRAYRLDPAKVRAGPRTGTTFDGRDLFAPAAGRIARGVAPAALGTPTSWHQGGFRPARRLADGASGTVAHVDTFGNVITNVPTEWVPRGSASVELRQTGAVPRRLPWVSSYEATGRGRLAALGSSFGTLELAVSEGSAARRLRVAPGASLRFTWRRGRALTGK